MTTLIALCGWLALIGLSAWRPNWAGRHGRWWILTAAVTVLALSPFWREVAYGAAERDWLLAGPKSAFLSVWILALLPILQRRIDVRRFALTLLAGLVAAAALGLGLDTARLALAGFAAEPLTGIGALAILLVLYLAGFALCLLAGFDCFPWDYPVWYAGLLLMMQSAVCPLLGIEIEIEIGAGHGVWVLGAALGVGAIIRRCG